MYYAYDPSDLEVGFDPRTKAKNITVSGRNVKSVMLAGLRACESYVAKIAVTAPGICPLSNIETFHTGEGKTPVKIDGPCYNTLSLHGPLYCPHHTLVLILLPFFQILKLNLRIWSLSFSRIVRQQGIWLGMLLALRNSCLWCVIFERWLNFKMLIFIWYLVPCT